MKTSLKKIKDCRLRLSVEVERDRVETRYREVLGEIQKKTALPGFREGKAPADLVEKKYAPEVREETIKSLVSETYYQAVTAEKAEPVSMPAISDIRYERGKTLSFTAEFESAPEFNLKNYKGIRLRKIPVDVTADDVEKGLASLLESAAELIDVTEPRAVQRGDFLAADIEMWQNGQYVPSKKGILLYAEPGGNDDFYEKVIGAQIDEVREISVDFSAEEKEKGLVGRKPYCKVWIRGIRKKKLPALDDEFAKRFGKENVESLREAVRKDVGKQQLGDSQERMKLELFDKLLALVNFPLPEGLVEKQRARLVEQARRQLSSMGIAGDKLENEMASIEKEAVKKAADQVKLYFILHKVAGKENVEVDEVELERRLNALVQESERPLEEVRRVFEDDLRESMLEKKTVDFLLANAKFEE